MTFVKHNIRYYIFKLKYLVAFLVFACAISFIGETSLINRISQQQEIAHLKAEIDEYDRKFEADRKTLNSLKHDEDAVKEVAREKYYMKTDNEDIFIIEDDLE
ncbi:MAG: septum formation initiator family protein [Bacteroidaceae bacterium]|nr:septum formation initiator family protein [Bacteroidaceae bacterium]